MDERTVRAIGVPTDFGANRRGVDMGPSAVRYAGLADEVRSAGAEYDDAGNVKVPPHHTDTDTDEGDPNAKFLEQTREVCSRLGDEVTESLDDGALPLVIGGDHSVAIGTLGASSRDSSTGVIWFDAHGDFNTPATTPSGNVHGMSLAASLGLGEFEDSWSVADIEEDNVVLVGTRDIDEGERDNLIESDVTVFTMPDIDRRGIGDVVEEAVETASDGVEGLHVSLDIDFLDPNEAPGVGTPVHGGVNYREAHLALETVARADSEDGVLRSMDVVEVNPVLDEHNRTATIAADLVASALGKKIL